MSFKIKQFIFFWMEEKETKDFNTDSYLEATQKVVFLGIIPNSPTPPPSTHLGIFCHFFGQPI